MERIATRPEAYVILSMHSLQRLNERVFHDGMFDRFCSRLNGIGSGCIAKKANEDGIYLLSLDRMHPNLIFILKKLEEGRKESGISTYEALTLEWTPRILRGGKRIHTEFAAVSDLARNARE